MSPWQVLHVGEKSLVCGWHAVHSVVSALLWLASGVNRLRV